MFHDFFCAKETKQLFLHTENDRYSASFYGFSDQEFFFFFAPNEMLYAVTANSASALACSEFAVGVQRWHGRIANVG